MGDTRESGVASRVRALLRARDGLGLRARPGVENRLSVGVLGRVSAVRARDDRIDDSKADPNMERSDTDPAAYDSDERGGEGARRDRGGDPRTEAGVRDDVYGVCPAKLWLPIPCPPPPSRRCVCGVRVHSRSAAAGGMVANDSCPSRVFSASNAA